MKKLNNYITERLKLTSKTSNYTCKPKNEQELHKILEERLKENKDADLNDIDVSEITYMGYKAFNNHYGLFEGLDPHNIKIDQWDVSNVTNMDHIFFSCRNLNCDVSDWDMSNVNSVSSMFENCVVFDCDLSNWNVRKITNMEYMFTCCERFKGKGLENWDVENVTDMKYMFWNCYQFNNDLNCWNTKNVKRLECMFSGCRILNKEPKWYKR